MTEAPRETCRVTVVVTTHDRPEDAARAVRSALAQTMDDLEVVVVDDGSTPPFVAPTGDDRVRTIRRDDAGGVCLARNLGLAAARGEWVTFLDDDDVLEPSMLEQSLAAAGASSLPPPVAVMSGLALVAPDGTELRRCLPPTLRKGEHYLLEGRGDLRAQNSLVIPTAVARAIGGWDEDFVLYEGDDFGIRLNLVASIQPHPAVLYRLTQHRNARLTGRRASIPRDMERTLAKHGALFRQHPRAHAKYMSTLGMYHLRAGDWRAAISWSARAVLRNPRRGRAWLYFGAAVAGPSALRVARRVRAPEAGVPFGALMRRRARKYGRRLLNYPRAVLSAPFVAATRALVPRSVPGATVQRSRRVLVLCIYRYENAATIVPFVDDALARGWEVRLWALDWVAPDLAAFTVGRSTGAKFPLLDRLARGAGDLDAFDWVVVADDDVVFTGGGTAELLAVAEAAGLDLVQPAHVELSHCDNEITRRRPLAVARLTTFVEIGPVFAVRCPWAACVVGGFECQTMGWGLELEWSDLASRGLRLGIVDAVGVRHLRPAGKAYDWREQHERVLRRLADRGYASMRDAQHTLATWWCWQRPPAWLGQRDGEPRAVDCRP